MNFLRIAVIQGSNTHKCNTHNTHGYKRKHFSDWEVPDMMQKHHIRDLSVHMTKNVLLNCTSLASVIHVQKINKFGFIDFFCNLQCPAIWVLLIPNNPNTFKSASNHIHICTYGYVMWLFLPTFLDQLWLNY